MIRRLRQVLGVGWAGAHMSLVTVSCDTAI